MNLFSDDLLLLRAIYMILMIASIMVGILILARIREIHLNMNSRLDQLLVSTKSEAHASGVLEERERTIAREASNERNDELDKASQKLPGLEIERLGR